MVIPPSIGNPYNGYINPYKYYWVDEIIPYYMEMSWELIDPIAHIKVPSVNLIFSLAASLTRIGPLEVDNPEFRNGGT